MTSYEKYVLLLCLIVFTLLTTVFSFMMTILTKQSLRLIGYGEEDKYILKQYEKTIRRGKQEAGWFSKAFTVFFACVIVILSIFTLMTQLAEKQTTKLPVYRVVYSDSMSDKFESNDYLFKNNLIFLMFNQFPYLLVVEKFNNIICNSL